MLTVTIERMGQSGDGVGRIPDGRLAFISGALPGESVAIAVTEERVNFVRGRVVQHLRESPEREVPPCPLYGECGGCALQHWNYAAECQYKENRVREALSRSGLDDTVVGTLRPSRNPYGYRNKGQFPFGGTAGAVIVGLYQRKTHQVVSAQHCDIQDELVNKVLLYAAEVANEVGLVPYDEGMRTGVLRHLLIRSSRFQGRALVVVVAARDDRLLGSFALKLRQRVPELAGVGLNINPKAGNRVLGAETRLLTGESHITEKLLDLKFRLSLTSFFQVNPEQAAVLYQTALEFLPPQSGEVWDLYSGVGTLAALAARRAVRVRAVEINREAVKDAQANFALNHLTNIVVETSRVEDVMEKWGQTPPDAVIADPPRAGLDRTVVDALKRLSPRQIVYISCNPETWARDVALFGSVYQLDRAVPVDMFPRTDHVEVASTLTLRE